MALQKPRYPVDYIGITQYYNTAHPALDLGWHTPNPPVYAAAAGTVYAAARDVDGANYVVIRHDNVIAGKLVYTLYWHLASYRVAKGATVKLGDRIGVMGQTGNAVGVHLHFEFWITPLSYTKWALSDKRKYAVDPQTYVYCYPDQTVSPNTKNVLKYTPQIDPGENVLAPGAKLSLKNAPLYASSDAARAAGRVSGTYYTWDSQIIRNRIRITNSTANVGRPGAVTGWIGKEYLPAVNRPTVYIVVSGDTLSGIAARSGVSLSALLAANPQIKDPNRIYPGDRITIPAN